MTLDLLYKYRCWDYKLHKRLLTHKEIYFSSPGDFNDPFDSTVPFRFDNVSEKQLRESAFRVVNKNYSKLSLKKKSKIVNEKLKEKRHKNQTHIEWWSNYLHEVFMKSFGVFSLTSDPENILMWSHYANSHRGFCIGFDYSELDKTIGKYVDARNIVLGIYEVEYVSEYPKLNMYELNTEEKSTKPFLLKSDQWKYEKEYRMILKSRRNIGIHVRERKFNLDNNVIKKIILGCRIPDDQQKEMIEIIKQNYPELKIYKSKLKKDCYGLDFVEV